MLQYWKCCCGPYSKRRQNSSKCCHKNTLETNNYRLSTMNLYLIPPITPSECVYDYFPYTHMQERTHLHTHVHTCTYPKRKSMRCLTCLASLTSFSISDFIYLEFWFECNYLILSSFKMVYLCSLHPLWINIYIRIRLKV